MKDAEFERLLEWIADGHLVDWDALRTRTIDAEQAALLDALQVVYDMRVAPAATAPRRAATYWHDHTGTSWGTYHLVEKIGEGGFGAVYRARDRWLGNEVALKVLHAGDRARLRDEGVKLASIRHPNVIEVVTFFEERDAAALAMRLIDGETLTEIVRQRRMDVREAALIGEDVCRALATVHAAKIIHCDIKAGNVMRSRDGRVILMDFGAGVPGTADGPMRLEGTPPYMAPELFAGSRVSNQSDIYSVGVLLFYLVTGEYPVQGRTFDDFRAAHAAGRRRRLVDLKSDLPKDFRQVVERALLPDPAARFDTAGEMQEALEALRRPLPDRPRPFLVVAQVVLAFVAVSFALGVLSSHYFNVALERVGYDNENAWTWLAYGLKAQVLPATLTMLALAGATATSAVCTIVLSTPLGRAGACVWLLRCWHQFTRAVGLHDVRSAASYVLVLSTAGLAAFIWLFQDLLRALLAAMPTEDAAVLSWLSTDFCGLHEGYQAVLSVMAALSTAGWWHVRQFSRQAHQPVSGALQAGGVATVMLMLLLLHFPYRMLNHNNFPPIVWEGQNCYNIGERDGMLRVFCPTYFNEVNSRINSPNRAAVTLERKDPESLFWRLSPSGHDRRVCVK